jgi:hypothetical protein
LVIPPTLYTRLPNVSEGGPRELCHYGHTVAAFAPVEHRNSPSDGGQAGVLCSSSADVNTATSGSFGKIDAFTHRAGGTGTGIGVQSGREIMTTAKRTHLIVKLCSSRDGGILSLNTAMTHLRRSEYHYSEPGSLEC